MDIATLQAEPRTGQGTRESRRLRRTGKLPGIIYGHGQTPQPVIVPAREISSLIEHGTHVVELKVAGEPKQVLIKEVQFDHLGDSVLHVDFALVDLNERIELSVPLEFKGTPVGTQEGGLLEMQLVDLEVECTVVQIPHSIRVNVAELKVGDNLHVSDLVLPAGVKAVTPADAIVASVRLKAAEVESTDEAGEGEEGQEPEIIGRKEKDEGEEKDEKD